MTQKSWQIRQACQADADRLTQCMHHAYRQLNAAYGGQALPPMQVDYAEEIRLYPVWVAYAGDTLVGGLILIHEQDYTTIANVAVHPDFQGYGLGRGLIEFAQQQAAQHGHQALRLVTHQAFTENINLYTYLGWKVDKHQENKIFMTKTLPTTNVVGSTS
ncbi:GNAT family N-acetyltransferase [Photobacterium atrarenae]|uniref:GNAT family N-acetyltransferase n=1 Tax=Photobacterium atrarenae TaxID=865757 RepID=A0ABY5GPY2_9GAMM|nr:GNAT family N-acetyltransferase [Photobacterium atrarenae]UTV30343.1 GNAT family N-acetyltransferase [Photobacterium atrarenae]